MLKMLRSLVQVDWIDCVTILINFGCLKSAKSSAHILWKDIQNTYIPINKGVKKKRISSISKNTCNYVLKIYRFWIDLIHFGCLKSI